MRLCSENKHYRTLSKQKFCLEDSPGLRAHFHGIIDAMTGNPDNFPAA
jgi:hypothetical protein